MPLENQFIRFERCEMFDLRCEMFDLRSLFDGSLMVVW
jgi:hypothetical protein